MIISLMFPYSTKFQKSDSLINSHSIANAKLSIELPLVIQLINGKHHSTYLLTQQKYHPRGAALINVYGIAIQVYPPHPYEFVKAKQKVHVCHACGSNFTDKYYKSPNNIIIKHIDRRIKEIIGIGNLLFNVDFAVAYYYFLKNIIMKKNMLCSVETFSSNRASR